MKEGKKEGGRGKEVVLRGGKEREGSKESERRWSERTGKREEMEVRDREGRKKEREEGKKRKWRLGKRMKERDRMKDREGRGRK